MGFPSPAKDYHEERIDLNDLIIKHPSATYFFQCRTDAMLGDGINKNCIAVIDRSLTPKNNDILIAVVDGEMIMRRLVKNLNDIYLVATNEKFRPIKVTEELNVWGVVVVIISNPNKINYVRLS